VLSIEHRAAPSQSGISLELRTEGDALALAVAEKPAALPIATMQSLDEQIQSALESAAGPLTTADLRRACRVRTATLCETLARLTTDGLIRKAERGYLRIG
jgi:predicted transcriptional regulator of viral defense system